MSDYQEVLYSIPVPYSMGDEVVEVYVDPDMGWYEWRVVRGSRVLHDSKNLGYGNCGIAMRDALIEVTKGL